MKSFVLEKTKYILTNSWFGLFLPAGVHQLLNHIDKPSSDKPQSTLKAHPAEFRLSRPTVSNAKP